MSQYSVQISGTRLTKAEYDSRWSIVELLCVLQQLEFIIIPSHRFVWHNVAHMLLTKKTQIKKCRMWQIEWKIKLIHVVECRGRIKEHHPEKRSCSVIWCYCCSYLCIICQMASRVKQAVVGVGGCCILELFGLCTGTSLHRSSKLANDAVMMVMVLITCCTAVLCWVSEAGHRRHF